MLSSASAPADPCAEQATFDETITPGRVGFAASGGGYRAVLVHVGALWRLNELGWLRRVDRFSGVSGGSIALGRLAVVWPQLAWSGSTASNFLDVVAAPLIRFARSPVDVLAVLNGLIPVLRRRNYLERVLRERLIGGLLLNELPKHPQFTFNATSMQSGVSFRFTRTYARDYRVGCIPYPAISVAAAIAASAAFPPFLSPYRLDLRRTPLQPTRGFDLDRRLLTQIVLSDGGVYDNLGLQTLTRFETVIASDAGAPGVVDAAPAGFWPIQILRVLGLLAEQTRARRRSEFVDRICRGKRKGTLWTFKTFLDAYPPPPDHIPLLVVHRGQQRKLAAVATRLWPLSNATTHELVNLGYALADAGLRSRMSLTGAPPSWPYPQYALEAAPDSGDRVLAGSPGARDS